MNGRIRSIKPELHARVDVASLPDLAWRTFIGLYSMVDDLGRAAAAPAYVAGQLFWASPRSVDDVQGALDLLAERGLIAIYVVAGVAYLEIAGWSEKGSDTYQHISHPQPARYPDRNGTRCVTGTTPGMVPGTVPTPIRSDSDPNTKSKTSTKGRASRGTAAALPPSGWTPSTGGLADTEIQKRIAARELTQAEVDAALEKFAAYGDAKGWFRSTAAVVDAKAARWIHDETPSRGNGHASVDEDADYTTGPSGVRTLGSE